MRIVANETHISRREAIGQYAGITGLLILLGGLIFSCTISVHWTTMQLVLGLTTVVGILLSFVGGYFGDRFAGPNAHYRRVREALKGLNDDYTLLQYTLPPPHVLLEPSGLTVLVVRPQAGEVTYSDGKWRHHQRAKILRQLAGQPGLGRPELEVDWQVERLKRYLTKRLPEVEVPVRGVVLFIHPEVQLEFKDEPPVPTFYEKQIKSWLRGSGERRMLPSDVRRRLSQELVEGHTTVSDE